MLNACLEVMILFLIPSLIIYSFDIGYIWYYTHSRARIIVSVWVEKRPVVADEIIVMYPKRVWHNVHNVTFEATIGERYLIVVYYQGHMRQVLVGPVKDKDYYVMINFPG